MSIKISYNNVVLLTISLATAEKLDRKYLPPPGSQFSGGSLGATDVPLELPKVKDLFKNERLPEIPELVIGIDRSPSQFETPNTSPTKIPSSIFKQSSPFSVLDDLSTAAPITSINSEPPLNDFDNFQYSVGSNFSPIFPIHKTDNSPKLHTINKNTNIPTFDKLKQAYLPPYKGNVESITDVTSSIGSSTIIPSVTNEKEISNEYKYIQPDSDGNEYTSLNPIHQSHNIPSMLSPSYSNNFDTTKSPDNYDTSISSQYSFTTTNTPGQPGRIQSLTDRQAVILNYDQLKTPEGYAYSYDTSNGIHADESGSATNGVKAKGSYSYIGDDGNIYHITYTADENGFRPKGAHLPTSPPIPDAILKVIEQAANEKEAGIYDDGSYDEKKYGHKKYQERYPQNNNIIDRVIMSHENDEVSMKNGDQFDEYIDLQRQNGQYEINKNQENIFGDNTEPATYNKNHDNNAYQNTILNKSSHDNSLLQPENSNSQIDSFGSKQVPNDLIGSDINKFSDKYPLINNNDIFGPNHNSKINPHTTAGYQYFSPENKSYKTKLESLPSRFSGIDRDVNVEEVNRNITEEVTTKPFLTPYVSRKDDDLEIYDFDENLLENKLEENHEDTLPTKSLQNNIRPIDQSLNFGKENDSHEFTSGDVPGQHQQYDKLKDSNDLVPLLEEGYFYQNTNQPFVTARPETFHTKSTAIPTEFPSRFTTTETKDINGHAPENNQLLFENLTVDPLPTQTMHPIFVVNESVPSHPKVNDRFDLISTTKSTQGSRPGLVSDGARFEMPYRPSIEATTHPDKTTTQNIIGEDFSGPKQLQRFDPFTGYYY